VAEEERGSPAPFVAAAAVFTLVVAGVAVLTRTRGDGLTEEQRVGRAVVGQNDALQRENHADYRQYTCSQERSTEAEFLAAQRNSVVERGARFVDEVTDIKIDGDSATATVTYHFDKDSGSKRSSPLVFAREDGQWKVCSAFR
jgi:Domain of unknown function (DUF4878)